MLENVILELNKHKAHLKNATGWGIFPMQMASDVMKKAAKDIDRVHDKAQTKIAKARGK